MTKNLKIFLIFVATIIASVVFNISVDAEEFTIDNNTIQYTVSAGTVYWESSYHFGFGKHSTVSDSNKYTNVIDNKLNVRINGYSFINSSGEIVDSFFNENIQKFSFSSDNTNELMVHIEEADKCKCRLGWIKFSQINDIENNSYLSSEIPKEKKEEEDWFKTSEKKNVDKTAHTLKKSIESDSSIPIDSYILADFSGSMCEFQADVLEKLEDTSGKKYVFANDIEEFIPDKNPLEYNIGGATDIANALNTIAINSKTDSHIYILTDLNNNCDTILQSNDKFTGKITIVYYPSFYNLAMYFMKQLRSAYPNAIITGF